MNNAETELESYKNKTEEAIRDERQNIKDKVNKYMIETYERFDFLAERVVQGK